jgi:hypothetical protein
LPVTLPCHAPSWTLLPAWVLRSARLSAQPQPAPLWTEALAPSCPSSERAGGCVDVGHLVGPQWKNTCCAAVVEGSGSASAGNGEQDGGRERTGSEK